MRPDHNEASSSSIRSATELSPGIQILPSPERCPSAQPSAPCLFGVAGLLRTGFILFLSMLPLNFEVICAQDRLPEQQLKTAGQSLLITIIDGADAINNVRRRTAREAIIQVEDHNHKPIAGATLTAVLPNDGASGVFMAGGRTFQGTTATNGQIKFTFQPNRVPGKYQIRLNASFQGQTGLGSIAQTNVLGIAAAAGGLSLAAKVIIVVAVGAGAAAGTSVAITRAGRGAPPSNPPPTTITIAPGSGPVVIGPPR
jgi:hypothetical protein